MHKGDSMKAKESIDFSPHTFLLILFSLHFTLSLITLYLYLSVF